MHLQGHRLKIYLVGGAVRDTLLGLPVLERDWVVVGATPEDMLSQGFKAVGKEFPVFLHPTTREEYALARTERKVTKGYRGFQFYTDASVTLEEDLQRRDLTINAMALGTDGTLIDPYGGKRDLREKILRHVSPAFSEDPVRVLRVARFATKFSDFTVHPSTVALMRHMVTVGEINALVNDRVWKEFSRALANPAPERFFQVLEDCMAQSILFPELNTSASQETLLKAKCSDSSLIRFAALMSASNLSQLQRFCVQYPVPKLYQELATLVVNYKEVPLQLLEKKPTEWLIFLQNTDALRRFGRFQQFLSVVRLLYPQISQAHVSSIFAVLEAIRKVDLTPLQQQGLSGEAFADALKALRLAAIEAQLKHNPRH